MDKTILVVGDANADLVAPVATLPTVGEDVAVPRLLWASGGAAANVATGLALLGMPTKLLACVGRDPAADVALRAAIQAGVNLDFLQRTDELATGLCYTLVTPGGERSFLSFRGANIAMAMPKGDPFAGVGWLHITGYALLEGPQRATTLALIEQANTRAVPISLDLCLPLVRQHAASTHDLLPCIQIVFGNQHEMHLLAPVPSERGLIVEKSGAAGCLLRGSTSARIPAFIVQAVDTNGCGDAFVAAFLATLAAGYSAEHAARTANAAGALTSLHHGAAEAMPSRTALEQFLAVHSS